LNPEIIRNEKILHSFNDEGFFVLALYLRSESARYSEASAKFLYCGLPVRPYGMSRSDCGKSICWKKLNPEIIRNEKILHSFNDEGFFVLALYLIYLKHSPRFLRSESARYSEASAKFLYCGLPVRPYGMSQIEPGNH
jgi:hypothetical protein